MHAVVDQYAKADELQVKAPSEVQYRRDSSTIIKATLYIPSFLSEAPQLRKQ